MNRREMLRAIMAAPVGAATVSSSIPVREIVLHANDVVADMRVHGDEHGRYFAMTLMNKPWPVAGERVRFDYEALHLVGVVENTDTEPLHPHGRCFHHLVGRVLEFTALAKNEA